jgi:hypothetical protein
MLQHYCFSNSYVQYGIRNWAIIEEAIKNIQFRKDIMVLLYRYYRCHIQGKGIEIPLIGKDAFSRMKIYGDARNV